MNTTQSSVQSSALLMAHLNKRAVFRDTSILILATVQEIRITPARLRVRLELIDELMPAGQQNPTPARKDFHGERNLGVFDGAAAPLVLAFSPGRLCCPSSRKQRNPHGGQRGSLATHWKWPRWRVMKAVDRHAETAAELDVFPPSPSLRRTSLPALLDRAFKGEL